MITGGIIVVKIYTLLT